MSKTVILMRHAKSCRNSGHLEDFNRPLNARGKKNAEMVARNLSSRAYSPELVVCSTAARCRETLDHMTPHFSEKIKIEYLEKLYLASSNTICQTIRSLEFSIGAMLLIGHNPGISDLFQRLRLRPTNECKYSLIQKYPTAAASIFKIDIDNWTDFNTRDTTLIEFITPKNIQN